MQIVKITEEVYYDPKPKTPEERKAKHDAILARLNVPVYLGTLASVEYDAKTDRYTASFSPGEGKKLALKAIDSVAAFLAEHTTGQGYWLGLIQAGALVDVNLIQS